jgi:hypothetical protein
MIDMQCATLAVTIKDKVDKCSAPDSIRAMKGVQRKLPWVSKRAMSRILSDYALGLASTSRGGGYPGRTAGRPISGYVGRHAAAYPAGAQARCGGRTCMNLSETETLQWLSKRPHLAVGEGQPGWEHRCSKRSSKRKA